MRHVRYPQYYVWFVLLAALDVMATWVVLHLGGREANAFANWVLQRWQLPGMVALKFAAVVIVVLICEFIGKHRPTTGLRVIQAAIVLYAIPVAIGISLIVRVLTTN